MKVLLTGAFSSHNRGDEARVKCTVRALSDELDNVSFTLLTSQPEADKKIYQEAGIAIQDKYSLVRKNINADLSKHLRVLELLLELIGAMFWSMSSGRIQLWRSKELSDYDIFIDVSGETLTDYYGQGSLLRCLHSLLVGLLLHKPVVVYAQSIGPFENWPGRFLAPFLLNRTELILVRDSYSLKQLSFSKIDRPHIEQTADPAFILKSATKERTLQILEHENFGRKGRGPLLGISICRGGYRRSISGEGNIEDIFSSFSENLVNALDQLIQIMDIDILFIPHVVSNLQDDRAAASEIIKYSKNRDRITSLTGEYSAEELKGVIGSCDIFISTRMHASIASLSQCIPTIAIAYSHKSVSLMEQLGLKECSYNIEELTSEGLIKKIIDMWERQKQIRLQLCEQIPKTQSKSKQSAILVREYHQDKSS